MRGRISLCSTAPDDLQRSRLEAKDEVALVTEGVDISSSFRRRSLLAMTLHLRTQDERFCGSRKNFRNPLLAVGLGSAVKAPSQSASPAQGGWCV